MSAFVEWIEEQVRARRWSNSELARQAGLSAGGISMVLNGKQKPGLQFCFGVAQAFNEPPEKLLRLAGFLPSRPARDEELEEIAYFYSQMTPEAQEHFRIIARAFARGRLPGGSSD